MKEKEWNQKKKKFLNLKKDIVKGTFMGEKR